MRELWINGRDAAGDLVALAQDLVRIPSYSGEEGPVVQFVAARMAALGFDEVVIDRCGNALGRIGDGGRAILFESHVDTVAVTDGERWSADPFGGELRGGSLWGRGSVDMKSGAAASIYAALLARQRGLLKGKRVYVSCSVDEENCDGEAVAHMLEERRLQPDYAVICEPSANLICSGHKGKAQAVIRTRGVSAHGSAPEKGVNAVYAMAEVIRRVEQANAGLSRAGGRGATLALTRISSSAVSINAVPDACEIYLDRRMAPGESEQAITAELDRLVAGVDAAWEIGGLQRKTWTGEALSYTPFHLAWEIDLAHPLAQAFSAAYGETFGAAPARYEFWDFSTNAVATVRLGVPTIGFGPGEYKLAHMRDEHCPVEQIVDACEVYAQAVGRL